MKTRILKTGAVVMIFLMAGLSTFSQPQKGKMMAEKPGYHMQMRMQNMLNLTDEQKTQMKDLRLERTKEMLPLQNRMRVLMAEYKELISAEKPDTKAINGNIDDRTKLMNEIMKKKADYQLKFRNILTEEQWLMIQNHKRKMGSGKGMGRGYGKPGMRCPVNGPGPRQTAPSPPMQKMRNM